MNNFVIPSRDKPNTTELSNYLDESLRSFSDITGIPVTYFSDDDHIQAEYLPKQKICRIFSAYTDCTGLCRAALASAGQFTTRLGEPYIFLCKSGLTNIASSLIIDGVFIGYVIAGPIVMGELRTSTINKFQELNNLNSQTVNLAEMIASNMQTYQPKQVSEIALLLYNSIVAAVASANTDYDKLRNQYNNFSNINIDIQKYKKEHSAFSYPYDLEKTLVEHVLDGRAAEAEEDLRKMLTSFSILEAGDLHGIKDKTLWLFAIVIRLSSRKQSNLNEILDTDLDVINQISEADNLDHLTEIAVHLIRLISNNMISSVYGGDSQIISKALQFINMNYLNRITLQMIEEELHVNGSYFSTLFKNEMGKPFTQYVNSLKVAKACELLITTNLNILDISMSIGFDDQSYFTKVFKREAGLTPKQYRNSYTKAHDGTGLQTNQTACNSVR
ncbi:hypothetical protein BHK98_08760 [Hornefia porci]|uniref:HTH araC/xylS-type domain-containing protein n=1 Tax=Hornefia porci TaxID=2652292 RepID=A0A1Q9JJ36_9FIRM|nr:helix-turn-helix domain-containing protein [Hornefia porci]OLR56147.1 hypothetical protein BHK98_08760 [Hornefia porci]